MLNDFFNNSMHSHTSSRSAAQATIGKHTLATIAGHDTVSNNRSSGPPLTPPELSPSTPSTSPPPFEPERPRDTPLQSSPTTQFTVPLIERRSQSM
ncbi:uncharacterized protein FOMMEDRAFT_152105 [Fomitiporia mediterranea MF3/22]|uniref:uncharacterized protein n=1 Tax=Fomitiporia mediterranea (strain MF3/22) TaxID=694068 RepID=UPI00044098F4|nr:uncharacterized protein FOMMEDRAFT_152105 [Fomitiporia mediterranea MF3/22]EJD06795.1 hypothetical protein FOMMEDRAFT_152105 [Fomitiporia mediterranea MF3/22]